MLDISRLEHFPSPILLLLYTIMAYYGVSAQTCPNATLTISCNITTPGPVTRWVVTSGYCPSNDIILSQPPGTDCGSKNDSCGPFVATNLVPPSGMACTTSVLSVVAAPQLNGTNISCYSNEILQYQHIISITLISPSLPLVTVHPMGNGLVVSCTPGANGDPPTSYDITVEPNGTHIVTASNGMVEQNIPGLLPNTTYTVKVIAINCAGSSGVVIVNATTAHIAVGVGVGVGVGMPLIMVIIAVVIMMLYKSYHPTKQLAEMPIIIGKQIRYAFLNYHKECFKHWIFIIVCNDTSHRGQVFQLDNERFVYLKERQTPPSSDQLWWRKDGPDGSFTIVSMSNGRALKRDPETSQLLLCDVSEEGDQWMMKGNNIVCKLTSTMLHSDNKSVLYCYDKGFNETRHSFTFQNMEYSIEDMESKLVVSINPSDQLVCGPKDNQALWYKAFPEYPTNKSFLIIAVMKTEKLHVITCTVDGENHTAEDYLWKEEDGDIVSVRCGHLIGVQDPGIGASLILCEKEESKHTFKMIYCDVLKQKDASCTLL
eukprot:Em0005g613a